MIARPRRLFWVAALLVTCTPALSRADGATVCRDSYDRSQILRDKGELIEARRLLRECSSVECSAFVQRECQGWLADVEARVSSVVLSAKGADGNDLVDVVVTVDGQDSPHKLDGRAFDVDPGEHTFLFLAGDGKTAERRVLVREREKGQVVAATLAALEPAPAPTPAEEPRRLPLVETTGAHPLKTAGFITGGVGLVSVAIGAIFGLKASRTLSAPRCDTAEKVCDPGVIDEAKTAAKISTIGFVAGIALVAGGVTMVLVAPKRRTAATETKSGGLVAAPMIGWSAAGVSLGGQWW
jgi:hypothetical protein